MPKIHRHDRRLASKASQLNFLWEKRRFVLYVTSGGAKRAYMQLRPVPPDMEGVMSTTILDVTAVRQRRVFRQVKKRLADWRQFARSRNELMSLGDRALEDIGISQSMARFEASKPFWMV
jgi:uncharacterized protein YjiS (DUF1127 family)